MFAGRENRFDSLTLRVWTAILATLLCVLAGYPAAAQSRPKNILVIYSFSHRVDSSFLKSELQTAIAQPVDLYLEYLEGRRLDDQQYENAVAATFQDTYSRVKLDLVIAEGYLALQFCLKHRDNLFPGIPIVFFDVDNLRLTGQKMWPGVTGVTAPMTVRATVDFALRLHPATTAVAVIADDSAPDRYWLSLIQPELLRYQSKVREIDLVGLPPDQLLKKVAELPPHTVVLFQLAEKESPRPATSAYDILAAVSRRFPTYGTHPLSCLNHGCIGGVGFNGEQQVSSAAQLAKRVLSGERPENIPVIHPSGNQVKVDWRQLRRWNIPQSALPSDSLVLYRDPTMWERDRKGIIISLLLIVGELFLIIGLLWQRARKRRAEAVLRESEERFRVMVDTTPSFVWMCDPQGRITYRNERRLSFIGSDTGPHKGLDSSARYPDSQISYIHPDDIGSVTETLTKALKTHKPFSIEYRLRRSDGVYRWMLDFAAPRVNGDGSFAGFIGSAIDTTDQKLAQQTLETVSGQLIEAQEKERGRIARDLHDDIGQRLALLSMELDQANSRSHGSSPVTTMSLEEIRKHCSEIATDVQALSHQLHSSKLDYLGLAAAVRGFCKEFAHRHSATIVFTEKNVPKHLPEDISLCLFRVVQEALHNAIKYSGTDQFAVTLTAVPDEIQLVVLDTGAGFDIEEAKRNRGLGLVSMQERINLVHGKFSVYSKPGMGTRVLAVVPCVIQNAPPAIHESPKETATMMDVA